MKNTLILIITLLLCTIVIPLSAQKLSLKKQRGYKEYYHNFILDSLNVKQPDLKTIDVEIRIIHYEWIYSEKKDGKNRTLLQLIKKKDGSWSGTRYSYYHYSIDNGDYNFKDAEVSPVEFKDTWNDSWETIINEGYLNMPVEDDIEKRIPKGYIRSITAGGGGIRVYVYTDKRKRYGHFSSITEDHSLYKKCLRSGLPEPLIGYLKKYFDFAVLLKKEFDLKK